MMHHPTRPALILAAALLALGLLAGCSDDAADPAVSAAGGDDYAALDFSDPYGGLTASDEQEAFADEALLAMSLAGEGEEIADPVADDPAVREMLRRGEMAPDPADTTRPRFTFVHLRWGMLRDMMDTLAVEPPCEVTDWTGSFHVDRGVLLVRRVIRFERPLDHIIFPRLDPMTVGVVSHTACGFDGVVLLDLRLPDVEGLDVLQALLTREERWIVHTPRLDLRATGTGDAFTALLLGHWLRTRDCRRTLEAATSAMFALVEATMKAGATELALIEAQDAFARPRPRFRAAPL